MTRTIPAPQLEGSEREPLPPGPYRLEWPDEQGGLFSVWGRQGTPPDFADGWAIPLVAKGVQSAMEWLMAHLNEHVEVDEQMRAIPTGMRPSPGSWSRYDTDDEHVLHVWDAATSWDIRIPKAAARPSEDPR